MHLFCLEGNTRDIRHLKLASYYPVLSLDKKLVNCRQLADYMHRRAVMEPNVTFDTDT